MDAIRKFEISETAENEYRNLCNQIEKVFKHTRQGSFQTRYRYINGVEHFAKFLAEVYKKQNMNRIQPKHLQAYAEQMQEMGYSKSYITTNLSAIRCFIDLNGGDSKKLPSNKELGVNPRTRADRIGENKAWSIDEVKKFIIFAESVGEKRYADMVALAFEQGLRIHEVARLDKSDLRRALQEHQLTVKGKGGLIRSVPVENNQLIQRLYLETPQGEKVFIRNGEQTHRVINSLQSFIARNQQKFVIGNDDKSRTFHGLRHLYAQIKYRELLERGMDDQKAKFQVAKLLGHFRVEITEIYLN